MYAIQLVQEAGKWLLSILVHDSNLEGIFPGHKQTMCLKVKNRFLIVIDLLPTLEWARSQWHLPRGNGVH